MSKELSPLRQKDIRTGEQQERERILTFLEEERRIANVILAKEDCSSDCYKCDLIGGSTLGLVDRLTTFLIGEEDEVPEA